MSLFNNTVSASDMIVFAKHHQYQYRRRLARLFSLLMILAASLALAILMRTPHHHLISDGLEQQQQHQHQRQHQRQQQQQQQQQQQIQRRQAMPVQPLLLWPAKRIDPKIDTARKPYLSIHGSANSSSSSSSEEISDGSSNGTGGRRKHVRDRDRVNDLKFLHGEDANSGQRGTLHSHQPPGAGWSVPRLKASAFRAHNIRRVALVSEACLPKIDGVAKTTWLVTQHHLNEGRNVLLICPALSLYGYRESDNKLLPKPPPGTKGSLLMAAATSVRPPGFPYETRIGLPHLHHDPILEAFEPDLVQVSNKDGQTNLQKTKCVCSRVRI